MKKIITKYREAKRHNIPLIRDRTKIIDLTGEYSDNPHDRCGQCGGVAITLRDYTGAPVAKACKTCKLVWWRMEVEVKKIEVHYISYGEEEV